MGVDTFIRVTASGEVMGENDDAAPGDFASEVRFQALSNDTAIVMVTNLQKLYGPNKSYQITVQEFTPTSAGSLSPSRFPGLASPIFDRAKPDSFAERTDILISSSGNEETLGIPSSQAVEFVIVLELAQESP